MIEKVRIPAQELFGESVEDCSAHLSAVLPPIFQTYGGDAFLCALAKHFGGALHRAMGNGFSPRHARMLLGLVEAMAFEPDPPA